MRVPSSKTSPRGRAGAKGWRRARRAAVPAAVLLVALIAATTTQGSSGIVSYFELGPGTPAGCFGFECHFEEPNSFDSPDDTAVNADGTGGASPGDVYVLDGNRGSRLQQLSASNDFIRLWGSGVVKSGPGNADELQAVRVDAGGGSFKLGFGADITSDILTTASAAQVEAALNGLASIGAGGVSVSGGPGDAGGTTPYLVNFNGGSLAGKNQPLLKTAAGTTPLSGGAATVSTYTTRHGEAGFEICHPAAGDECTASNLGSVDGNPTFSRESGLGGNLHGQSGSLGMAIDQVSGALYISNRQHIEAYSADGHWLRAWGRDVVAAGPDDSVASDEQQSITVTATGGTFTLGFSPTFSPAPPITTAIPYNASAATVEAALNALSTIGGAQSSVSVTGSNPYSVTFNGLLGGDDLNELTATATGLTGPGKAVTVATIVDGGGYEICEVDDACKEGTSAGGAVSAPHAAALAVAPEGAPNAGNVLAADANLRRVVEFTAAGAFIRMFGFDVDGTEPSTGFEVCTAESGHTCKAGTAGKGIGQFREIRKVAEDSSGAIYTAEGPCHPGNSGCGATGRVQKFTPGVGLGLTPSFFGTNEVQVLTVNAGAGQFRLGFNAQRDGTFGTGDITKGSTTITNVSTIQGTFVAGELIRNTTGGIVPEDKILAVGPGTITVSRPAPFSQTGRTLHSEMPYYTSDLPYNASPGEVEAALNALPSTAGIGGSVSVVSGGPGSYLVSFDGGQLVGTDVPQIRGLDGTTPLSGGTGTGANTAAAATPTPGGPNATNTFNAGYGIEIDSADDLHVARYFSFGAASCPDGSLAPSETRIEELDSSGAVLGLSDPCQRTPGFGQEEIPNLAVNPTTGRAYLTDGQRGFAFGYSGFRTNVFGPPGPGPDLTLDPVSSISATGGTIAGTVDPNGPGTSYPDVTGTPSSYRTTYRVEYKKASESEWTKYSPDTPIGSGTGPVGFSVGVGGLAPKTPYELKVVAVKPFTATVEEIATFTTAPAPPEIESFSSSNVTATSADLHALINPQGTETTYRFEYGTTTAYGQSTPETSVGDSLEGQELTQHIKGLEDTVYHFRVIATNALGTVTSEDQTFTFHPPVCPNQTVRQQTGAAYLPDCRAYELVSPEDAGGTMLFTGGPQSPYATNPPRLAFTGLFAAIPGAGDRNPINTAGDLYIATRGPSRWTSRYIGPSSEEVGCAGGRPIVSSTGFATSIQNDVIADPSLGRIIDWNLGNPLECFSGVFGGLRFEDLNTAAVGSNAPYVWNADGDFLDRWPTTVADVAGAKESFDCPQNRYTHPYPPGFFANIPVSYFCSTYIDASKDLRHFVFSTQSGLFGEGGLTEAPGSAYDNDTESNTLNLVSELQNGESIGQEPEAKAGPEELIQFPSISEDGSHILMGTATKPACKQVNFPSPAGESNVDPLCPIITQPTHLYMRVNDAITYDVSGGKAVKYIDSTPDGTKVYFTSAEQLTGDDDDQSTDLFMWSENDAAPQLIRVSAGESAPAGNADNCVTNWTKNCDIATYDDSRIATIPGNRGGLGSWAGSNPNPGYTDNAIAAQSGDIYFYSPEQLISGKGVPGRQNLYVYRDGDLQLVAPLEDDPYCIEYQEGTLLSRCSNGAAGRLQVTPDGRYAAFVTTSRITAYDNQGFAEMYRYDADAERVQCVSCRPDGSPPESDVRGSQGGRFITDDGRVFFDTAEPLDPRDTNARLGPLGQKEGADVYEFVDGRAQLITSGTGTGEGGQGFLSLQSVAGLYGVSADGTDVYFGTFDTLVGQDRNGSQLKFYDARTNGGFSFVPPPLPCAAADECRGPSSGAPAPLASGTGAALGVSGNARVQRQSKKRKAQKRKAQKRKRNRVARRQKGGQR